MVEEGLGGGFSKAYRKQRKNVFIAEVPRVEKDWYKVKAVTVDVV